MYIPSDIEKSASHSLKVSVKNPLNLFSFLQRSVIIVSFKDTLNQLCILYHLLIKIRAITFIYLNHAHYSTTTLFGKKLPDIANKRTLFVIIRKFVKLLLIILGNVTKECVYGPINYFA